MGRPLRNFTVGMYHVAAHASDTRYLFVTDEDRETFLETLAFSFPGSGVGLLDYVLMGNHYHALVATPDARLSKALHRLHTEYSKRHNRAHKRTAHLFRAHCFARRVTTDQQLRAAYRYVARNPVRADLVADPFDWPWSASRVHGGREHPTVPLDDRPLRQLFGDDPAWRARYSDLIHWDGDEEEKALAA